MNEQKDIVFENQTEFRIDELKKHLTNWLNQKKERGLTTER